MLLFQGEGFPTQQVTPGPQGQLYLQPERGHRAGDPIQERQLKSCGSALAQPAGGEGCCLSGSWECVCIAQDVWACVHVTQGGSGTLEGPLALGSCTSAKYDLIFA